MFKSTNSLVTKRYSKFLEANNKSSEIDKYFKEFLYNQFGNVASKISYNLVYNDKKNYLIVKTDSKVVANELSLRINNLIRVFRGKSLKLQKIIIQ